MKQHKSAAPGVALIIVLGFLVIISALAVAFFTSVATELKASRNFASGVTTRQLNDSAVQIVMGQIAEATTRGINGKGVGTEAWASQPGMIRVFGATGLPDAYYLLYSSDDMIKQGSSLNGGTYDPGQELYSNGKSWDTLPAQWTDLNAPVMAWENVGGAAAEVPRFPIIDPRAFSDGSLQSSTPSPTTTYNTAWQNNAVEGFWYDTSGLVDGIKGPGSGGANNQRLPMPVKWIYVLQDGTLTAPTTSTGGTATFSYSDNRQPTQTNPIVGRMAFWTDDETCKLNLNTAAGYINNPLELPSGYTDPTMYAGSYWDTPRFYTAFDFGNPYYPPSLAAGTPQPGGGGLALCQLLQNEFQRYPGHPATTSLAPVFNGLLNNDGGQLTSPQLYGLLPRYSTLDMTNQAGTTVGGTQRVIVDDSNAGARGAQTQGTDGEPNTIDNREIQPKQDRLYASVDELLFGAHAGGMNNFSDTEASPGYARMVNDAYTKPALNGNNGNTPTVLTPQTIDRYRFFLTTQSRSPDLNLWGQPRVTVWPVRAENTSEISGMNVFDNLILFCSTIGLNSNPSANGRPDTSDHTASGTYQLTNNQFRYMFTRREVDNSSGTNTNGTPPTLLPATGFSTYYDCELPRNKYLLGTYLYNFLSGAVGTGTIPGFGTNWTAKFPAADAQSLLMEIFDYVRCANSQDTTTSLSSGQPVKFAPQGMILPSVPQTYQTPWQNGANGVKGSGRLSTICEATMVFYYAGPQMNPTAGTITVDSQQVSNTGWSRWDAASPHARYVKETAIPNSSPQHNWSQGFMRAFLLFSTFDPMQGYAPKADPVNQGVNNYYAPTGSTLPATPQLAISAGWTGGADPTIQWYVNGAPSGANLGMGWYCGPAGKLVNGNIPMVNGLASPYTAVNRAPGSYWGGRNFGGYEGFMHTLMGPGSSQTNGKNTYPGLEKVAYSPTNLANSAMVSGTGTDFATTMYPTATGAATWVTGSTGTSLTNQFVATTGAQEFYPFQTMNVPTAQAPSGAQALLVPQNATGFKFNGGTLQVTLYYGGVTSQNQMQQMNITFPATTVSGGWPVPMGGVGWGINTANTTVFLQPLKASPTVVAGSADVYTWAATQDAANLGGPVASATSVGAMGMNWWYWRGTGSFFPNTIASDYGKSAYKFRTSMQASWSFNTRLAWCQGTNMFATGGDANGINDDPSYAGQNNTNPIEYDGDRLHCIVQPGDTVRSILYWDGNNSTGSPLSNISPIKSGDIRVGQLEATVPITAFAPHPDYQTSHGRACVLRGGDGGFYFPIGASPATVLATSNNMNNEATLGNQIWLGSSNNERVAAAGAFGNLPWGGGVSANAKGVNGVLRSSDGKPGDWDNGAGAFPDGPYMNKQDEGNVIYKYLDVYTDTWIYPIPYFTFTQSYQVPGNSFTSPARQMPSPGMMGSLPAHVIGSGSYTSPIPHQWETLCFCPNPAGTNHPGNADPKDHLLLDLFSMPVVEPYPISEPFSTAGRVNLNYRIAPFDYIRRSTALRGALHSVRVTIANSQYTTGGTTANYAVYKTGIPQTTGTIPPGYSSIPPLPLSQNFRKLVDRDQTIEEMDAVYNTPGGFFKSASQICEMFLIPWNNSAPPMSSSSGASVATQAAPGPNISAMVNYWKSPFESGQANGDLTGDNEREKPYTDLYPRVCTKSNTYTVHVKVQTLRQLPRNVGNNPTAYNTWNEGKDVVLGEYRGASTIERYIQPDDPRIGIGTYNGSPQINPDTQSVEPLYRFRTVITKKFSP